MNTAIVSTVIGVVGVGFISVMIYYLEGVRSSIRDCKARIDTIESRLSQVEVSVARLEERLRGVDTHLDKVDTRLDKVDERLGRVEGILIRMEVTQQVICGHLGITVDHGEQQAPSVSAVGTGA